MDSLLNYNLNEIKDKIKDFNLEGFRAKQIFQALHQGKTFDEITTINKNLKTLLNENFNSIPVEILKTYTSNDGTTKFLFKLLDDQIVEGVLMQYKFGNTLCVSTQIGCAMGCKFCASGLDGLFRNLTTAEMLGQVVLVNKYLQSGLGEHRNITNIVLMGSGEPLTNYPNVAKFINLLTDTDGLMISERNISVSTCGIVNNIKQLADDGFKVTLSISLHAPNNEIRKSIMKVANAYTIEQLMDACRYYHKKTNRRMMFEYILIKDVNSKPNHAQELATLLKGLNAHVNLIPLNEVDGIDLQTVSNNTTFNFMRVLQQNGIQTTIRRTLGSDIDGACGQLKRRYLSEVA